MTRKITINTRSNGNYREEVINNRTHLVTEMISIEGDSTMNGLFYPDTEVANSYKQLDMKPAPAGHPTANGENISAFHPLAINAFNVGGFIRGSRKEGTRVFNELVFDLNVAMNDDRGTEIVSRIKKGERIGVSTGLNADIVNVSGRDEVRNINFDHVAVLLNESPAGENTFTVNEELIICNMGDKPKINQPKEVEDMDKEKIVLAAITNSANTLKDGDKERLMSMSESEFLAALFNSATVDIETATSVIESMGMTVNSKQDAESYSDYLSNKAQFDAFLSCKAQEREKKVDKIVNAEGSDLSIEDLADASDEFLDKLVGMIQPTLDYSAQGQPLTNSDRGLSADIELHEGA